MKLKLKKCKNFINGYLKLINGLLRFKTKMKYKTKTKMIQWGQKANSKQLILILS